MKTFIYKNMCTKRRARATFDEAQLSTSEADLLPNSRAFRGALARSKGTNTPDTAAVLTPPEDFCAFDDSSPFLKVRTLTVIIKCTFDDFGLFFEMDPMSHHNITVDVAPFSLISHMEWNNLLQFHMVIRVDTVPIFMVQEVQFALAALDVATHASFDLLVVPYHPYQKDQHAPLPQVDLDQLRGIHRVIHGWYLTDPVVLIKTENMANMADGKTHTRRTYLQGPEQDLLIEAKYVQLDKTRF
jgi:hypothetical protein